MATKTELLLVKKAMLEAVLQVAETRQHQVASKSGMKAEGDSMWSKMMENWQNLTKMQVKDGVAIIPLRGTITPDDPFASYFGETSLVDFQANFQEALTRADVKGIVINAYSPGGYVYGVEACGNMIFAARGTKPIYAYTDSLIASACYWVCAAADKIFLGSETAEVGSIGVYLAHFDYSGMLEQAGIKVTEITAGEYKGLGSPYEPLSPEDEKLLQKDVDYIYSRFVNAVARYRGMSAEDVLKSANGLTFYGADAVKRGLADSISTFQEVLAMATASEQQQQEQQQQSDAAKAKAEADAKALKAEQDKNTALAAELATYKAKEAGVAKDKLKSEATVAYKAAFGRDATAEEQETYAAADEVGRKALASTLKESAENREKLAQAAGLTTEQATDGKKDASDPNTSPLVLAARRLGMAATPK